MDPRSINDFDTFNVSKINKEEKNIKLDIMNKQASPNPLDIVRRLSVETKENVDRNFKGQIEDDYEIINSKEDVIKEEKNFYKDGRMKIYKE